MLQSATPRLMGSPARGRGKKASQWQPQRRRVQFEIRPLQVRRRRAISADQNTDVTRSLVLQVERCPIPFVLIAAALVRAWSRAATVPTVSALSPGLLPLQTDPLPTEPTEHSVTTSQATDQR